MFHPFHWRHSKAQSSLEFVCLVYLVRLQKVIFVLWKGWFGVDHFIIRCASNGNIGEEADILCALDGPVTYASISPYIVNLGRQRQWQSETRQIAIKIHKVQTYTQRVYLSEQTKCDYYHNCLIVQIYIFMWWFKKDSHMMTRADECLSARKAHDIRLIYNLTPRWCSNYDGARINYM